MKNANLNGTSVSYKYNSDGLRSYKKVGETVSEYEYLGDKLVYEKRGSTQFHYRYDASGTLASIKRVKASGSSYTVYVICNSRGDIDELRNENGSLYARYVYDTWGNTLHILDANGAEITNKSSLAVQNPFRYRGYYFDGESGLYYLQSRYYDPVTGRFISADCQLNIGYAISGSNVYSYCYNNPIILVDSFGTRPDVSGNMRGETLKQRQMSFACINSTYYVDGLKINPDDYDDDSFYNNNDRLRGSDSKRRERRQIDNAFGKDRSKREEKSRDLHDSKKGRGNDVNVPYGELENGDFWNAIRLIGGGAVLTWLIMNDCSGIGVLDDVAIPYVVYLMQKEM